ncbi:MAG: hypothetical protein ACJAYE_000423 [Candidatus Azotimanducaceae bacterium]|jgi:hypothetical protein
MMQCNIEEGPKATLQLSSQPQLENTDEYY